jgi:hypothetical protein
VQAVQDLAARGVHVVVIGFGDETRRASTAGCRRPSFFKRWRSPGTTRALPGDLGTISPCGPLNPCQGGVCLRQYYQAQDALELGAALAEITPTSTGSRASRHHSRADLRGAHPPHPERHEVPAGRRHLALRPAADGGPAIRFLGSLCTAIEASTAQNPVQLDLRILRVL